MLQLISGETLFQSSVYARMVYAGHTTGKSNAAAGARVSPGRHRSRHRRRCYAPSKQFTVLLIEKRILIQNPHSASPRSASPHTCIPHPIHRSRNPTRCSRQVRRPVEQDVQPRGEPEALLRELQVDLRPAARQIIVSKLTNRRLEAARDVRQGWRC